MVGVGCFLVGGRFFFRIFLSSVLLREFLYWRGLGGGDRGFGVFLVSC